MKDYFTPRQVAERLGVHVKTAQHWFYSDSLKTVRVGRRRLMRREDFEKRFGEKAAV